MDNIKLLDQEQLREELQRRADELSEEAELQFIVFFIAMNRDDWNDESFKNRLRCLWTAFCEHFGLEVDTMLYDNAMRELKNTGIAPEDGSGTYFADDFENFMCEYMV